MFPVERKNEFLKYVMITESLDRWSSVVYGYIIDNNIKNWKEGFDFVVKYNDDPSLVAYFMIRDGRAEPEWAMKVIENATSGDPSWAACRMVKDGFATQEWAMKVIESATTGDPSEAAYHMVGRGYGGYAKPQWAKEVIENATIGNPLMAAYFMARDRYATMEWYQEIRRKNDASS